MFSSFARHICLPALLAVACASASAQTWSAAQQEIWKVEELQWKLSAAKDDSWIEKMVHPNLSFWESDKAAPQTRASLQRWSRYQNEMGTVLVQELYPLAITVTGNTAVVQYRYLLARENYKKERETVSGRYTDVLLKEGGQWLFIGWSGGDDPKK